KPHWPGLLCARRLAGAALDVFQTDRAAGPAQPADGTRNLILAPHLGSYSVEGVALHRQRVGELVLRAASDGLSGRKVILNKEFYDRVVALPECARVTRYWWTGARLDKAATACGRRDERRPPLTGERWMSDRYLAGRGAWVTGGATGMGRAIALALAEAGADVAIGWLVETARGGVVPGQNVYTPSLDEMAAARDAIGAHGGRVLALPLDVCSSESVDAFHAATVEAFGRID